MSTVGKYGKLVDTRSEASKRRDRGKCRAVEDLLGEQDNSSILSSGENSVDLSGFTICQHQGTGWDTQASSRGSYLGCVWKDESIRASAWTYAGVWVRAYPWIYISISTKQELFPSSRTKPYQKNHWSLAGPPKSSGEHGALQICNNSSCVLE